MRPERVKREVVFCSNRREDCSDVFEGFVNGRQEINAVVHGSGRVLGQSVELTRDPSQ